MSETTTTAASDLASQYAAQVTSDLEHNIKEQERIGTEIAALQEQLATLQQDHAVLVNMQQALGIAASPVQPASAGGTVPAPRTKAAGSDAPKKTRAKKATAASGRTKARKPSAAKSPAASGSSAEPKLVDLVRQHLTEQSEPRSAAEIATALHQAQPERNIKTTVVRGTLENLVAKGQVQRTKQGTSVFYTTPDAPGQTARSAPSASSRATSEAAPKSSSKASRNASSKASPKASSKMQAEEQPEAQQDAVA
ncbi:hypothetical protein [Streptomyces bullii]|uniref:Regulatory protein n=1 Tax=Streptomyces bullii TaxID=349910 RepID=A0ABW0V0E1_9ACTN